MSPVLVVDDLPDAAQMLREAALLAFPASRCDVALSATQASLLVGSNRYALALIDLELGDGRGETLIARLRAEQPECIPVVATIHGDDNSVFHALKAGAEGYLLKDQSPQWMADQLQGIASGQPPLSPAIARRLLRHFQPPSVVSGSGSTSSIASGSLPSDASQADSEASVLSPRERDVLSLLARGESTGEIAQALGISKHTVGDHVKNLYRKLNIGSRAQAALKARGLGLA